MNTTRGIMTGLFACMAVVAMSCAEKGQVALTGPEVAAPAGAEQAALISIPFDATQFVSRVDNPYFPLVPGTVFSYAGGSDEGDETNTVEVLHETKTILGVVTTVVHDRVYLDGNLIEDTFDWYAQDRAGNVWYFGEDTKVIQNGVPVSTAGSWEAGKNGARAGIIMLARPKIGDTYRQEDAPGVVEDMGKVMSLKAGVQVPYGRFVGCLKTADWTPLEPGNRAFKYYAKGIGMVLEEENHGTQRVELVTVAGPGGTR